MNQDMAYLVSNEVPRTVVVCLEQVFHLSHEARQLLLVAKLHLELREDDQHHSVFICRLCKCFNI